MKTPNLADNIKQHLRLFASPIDGGVYAAIDINSLLNTMPLSTIAQTLHEYVRIAKKDNTMACHADGKVAVFIDDRVEYIQVMGRTSSV